MLRIAFVYDSPPEKANDPHDVSAEYEDSATIEWMVSTLSRLGSVIEIPWSREAAATIISESPDVLFNITEASGSRNRESLVPAIAESLDIPYTGSDAVALGLSLDKYLTKTIASKLGVRTPRCALIRPGEEISKLEEPIAGLTFPLIVKPNTGGSSMGIRSDSKVENMEDLLRVVSRSIEATAQPVIAEEFIVGRELDVGVIDDGELRTLPVAEIEFPEAGSEVFYSIEWKSEHQKTVRCPVDLPGSLENEINGATLAVFNAIGCVDIARVDFRVDENNLPYFIEINPLPGISPFYSIYPVQARAGGVTPERLIELLVQNALGRAGR